MLRVMKTKARQNFQVIFHCRRIITFRSFMEGKGQTNERTNLFTNCVVQISINLVLCLFENMLRSDCFSVWTDGYRVLHIGTNFFLFHSFSREFIKLSLIFYTNHPASMRMRHKIAATINQKFNLNFIISIIIFVYMKTAICILLWNVAIGECECARWDQCHIIWYTCDMQIASKRQIACEKKTYKVYYSW